MHTSRIGLAMLAVAAFFAGGNGSGEAAFAVDKKLTLRIDAIVEKAGIADGGPGVAVLVIHQRKVVVKKGYGLANLEPKTPIAAETTFELASLSKPFCATAILLLYDRGRLSLTDDVRKFVPELAAYDPKHPIRIVNLLQHTSGLPDYTEIDDPEPGPKGYVDNDVYADFLASHEDDFKPAFLPGARYDYSNTNYLLLAMIVERISKKSYGTFLRNDVLAPLEMRHTWVYETPEAVLAHPKFGWVNAVGYEKSKKKNGDADGYDAIWGAPPFRTETMLVTGDGSVWSSLDDMIHWDAGVTNRQLLKPATWKLALTPSRTKDGEVNAYGMGWELELDEKNHVTGFSHDGSWGGFRTVYYHSPEDELTIVILSNRAETDTDKLLDPIYDLFEDG